MRRTTRTIWTAQGIRRLASSLWMSSGFAEVNMPKQSGARQFGWFENPRGFRRDKLRNQRYLLLFHKAVYEFTLDSVAPLTFHLPSGVRIQPDRHLAETDMGSTPASLQLFVPKDRFLLSYLFHDSAYHHGGLYMAYPPYSDEFNFQPMSQFEADCLLRTMVRAEGASAVGAALIYRAVRLGGWASYRPYKP